MLQVLSSCYVIFLSWFLGNYFLCSSLTILSHSFHLMCHAFGLEGLHIFLQPWQWGSLSCFLSSVFCLNHNYSCRVSGNEYNLGGWEEGGREGKAYHHSTLIVFTFPLPPKITFKETKVNTEPYGSILIQQAIILNIFLVVRDPQCIDPLKSGKYIFSYILKFTWQPGRQSDIVWCFSGLQI